MISYIVLHPLMKQPSGIGKGGGGKALKQAQAELTQTKSELERTKAELEETKTMYQELFDRIMAMNEGTTAPKVKANSKYAEPTVSNMKSAYDDLHKFWQFPRIPDIRKELGWSREEFDNMIRTLRDNRTIQLYGADESIMTREEVRNCFVDENGFIQGIMVWNGR